MPALLALGSSWGIPEEGWQGWVQEQPAQQRDTTVCAPTGTLRQDWCPSMQTSLKALAQPGESAESRAGVPTLLFLLKLTGQARLFQRKRVYPSM